MPLLSRWFCFDGPKNLGLGNAYTPCLVIHVGSITNAEGNRLRTIVRHPKDPIEPSIAQPVLSSAQGFASLCIAGLVGMGVDCVQVLIHQLNSGGMDMLRPKWKRRPAQMHTA